MVNRVAVVGTGPGRGTDISGRSHAWAYRHADAYAAREDCEIVACADVVPEYASRFAAEFDVSEERVYENHGALLQDADPDVVSVCTPIPTHADIVVDCARADSVNAVHCEKPMASTWGEARGMAHVCDRHGVQLTFGHQRRFGEPFREAKRLLDDGEIGELKRIEISWGNFFDNGTHALDLAAMFNDEHRGAWVLGQVDYTKEHVRYGVHTADHAFVSWQYENGVHGIAATGDDVELAGGPYDFYDCWHRLVGADGVVEIGRRDGPALRSRRDGEGWRTHDVADEFEGRVDLAIDEVVEAHNEGRESELRAERALATTEILFAGHESSRRRGRVELPLTGVYDHPLESMVESGDLRPSIGDDRPPHPAEEEQQVED
ncbi:Gfo/Idh/MocA family protein [Halegenticoccus soli]|uniref:Gfo/Idh/MocA family protein n=1 Tax=Halegenticoccus soli TaxID=1985678 RepID=UPI000C6D479F|nr:Gfo/Idh/MocA family oxidoreductase [Halegenticoccus soli]